MKAVVYDHYGPPEVLRIEDVPTPAPQAGEVLVKVHATAVTRADVATREANRRSGAFVSVISRLVSGVRRPRQPILGSEFAGTVEGMGSGVTRLAVGDRVFGSTGFRFGTYAEYLCVRESSRIATMPAGMTFEDAASICDGGLNALWALRQAPVEKGQAVLVYGASGAIGTAGVQLARHFGAEVTAVCGAKNLELVRSLGATTAIDYMKHDFTRNGRKYDVIFDAVGKHSFTRSRGSLKPNGSYLATDGLGNLARGVWNRRFGSQKVRFAIPPRYTREDVLFLKGLIEAGEYRAVVDRTYRMQDAVAAARYVETEQKTGNVILTIAG
jgi:NADPH:quinone reductase-like Zn-dependent oxidoreductase